MIKVLHILSDTNIGGAGVHLIGLVKALDKKKVQVLVACPSGAQIKKIIDPSIPVIEVPSMAQDRSFNAGCIFDLVKIIKQNEIDIVHTHASLSGRIAGKMAHVKVVYSRHTVGAVYKPGSLKWMMNKYINRFLCNKVIAVSESIAEQLIAAGMPDSKIITIYNGIDIPSFAITFNPEEIKKKLDLNQEYVLLHIARLEEIKGHKYLFEALSRLADEEGKLKLIVVGDGSRKEELKELASLYKIEDKVVFTGHLADVKPIIAIADIVLLPSLSEALPIALLEGMCMAKPCIASRVGGIPEVVRDGESGLLIPPQNSEELKNAIIQLLNDQELRIKMGQAGKQIVKEKFDLKMKVKQIEEVYFELAGQIPVEGQ